MATFIALKVFEEVIVSSEALNFARVSIELVHNRQKFLARNSELFQQDVVSA